MKEHLGKSNPNGTFRIMGSQLCCSIKRAGHQPTLHVSSQKAQKTLGIIRKNTGNKIQLGIRPLLKTTQCPQPDTLFSFGSLHLKKDIAT